VPCEKIYTDQITGTKAECTGLSEALSHLREGDTFVVWRLDRLERSLRDLIAQNWRRSYAWLSHRFDFVALLLPFWLNSTDLLLHQRLRQALFELKQVPALARP